MLPLLVDTILDELAKRLALIERSGFINFFQNVGKLILIGKVYFLGQDSDFGRKMEVKTVFSIKGMCRELSEVLNEFVMDDKFRP